MVHVHWLFDVALNSTRNIEKVNKRTYNLCCVYTQITIHSLRFQIWSSVIGDCIYAALITKLLTQVYVFCNVENDWTRNLLFVNSVSLIAVKQCVRRSEIVSAIITFAWIFFMPTWCCWCDGSRAEIACFFRRNIIFSVYCMYHLRRGYQVEWCLHAGH